MAKKYTSKQSKKTAEKKYEYQYKSDYKSDWDIHKDYIGTFDAYEAMLIGQVYDSVSNSVDGSKITDSYTATLAKERADRVMAKLPDGETKSTGRVDIGKALFMDIIRQKWVYPNANAQFPFQEKLNMWQLYSSVYGYMPMFYDWNISNTGYVGPDCWLWNPRNLIPQQGRVSINDMDYVTALTWVGKKQLQAILDKDDVEDGYDREAIMMLLEKADDEMTEPDTEKDTEVSRSRISQATKRGICLATRYESGPDGHWITFAPDHGCIQVRDIPNPHKNGRIPFVVKYSQPLFDSFYGMGDFQRAKPLQFARDGLTNFYFASLKRNLSPGIIVNANGVVKHTLDVTAPNPVLMETIPNSIRPMPTNTAGLSTYQGVSSNLTGSLLSLFGSQNASIPGSESLNPSQGKTPAAIQMFTQKEATRDGAEQRHLEVAIEQLTDGFFSLIANISTEEIPVELFSEDIQSIVDAGYEDVLQMFKGDFKADPTLTGGTLTIKPEALKGIDYRFSIKADSTREMDREKKLAELERFLNNLGKFQNIIKDDPRVTLHPEEIAKTMGEVADIPNAQKFISFQDGPTAEEQQLMEQAQQMEQQMMQMQEQLQALQAEKEELEANQPVKVGDQLFEDKDVAGAAAGLLEL